MSSRNPGRKGSIHDHAHAWTAYGVLDGTESLERFRRVDDRSKAGYAKLELESVTEGNAGKVDLVPPFDIHAEQGGPTRSVAVILRSERVAGKVLAGQLQHGRQPVPANRRTDQHSLRDQIGSELHRRDAEDAE